MRVRSTLVELLACIVAAHFLAHEALAFNIVVKNEHEVRWPAGRISYRISQSQVPAGFDTALRRDKSGTMKSPEDAVHASFAAWAEAEGTDLQPIDEGPSQVNDTGKDEENTLIWINSGWRSLPFSPPPYAIAVTLTTYRNNGEIIDADIHFNGTDFNWANIDSSDESDGNYVDIQNIATHEIGHFLGLDHSSDDAMEIQPGLAEAVMYYASAPGDISRRILYGDDRAAIKHLYPKASPVTPRLDSISNTLANNTDFQFVTELKGDFSELTLVRLYNSDTGVVVMGKVIERYEGAIVVAFDLGGIPPGKYDIVASNSPDTQTTLAQAVAIDGIAVAYQKAETSSGGCGILSNGATGNELGFATILILLTLIGFLGRLRALRA